MAGCADGFRYRAFVSYSHRDAGWSRWLHRALETYRLPKALIGQPSPLGPVPARLVPIFRDREELASAYDLTSHVLDALAHAQALIVICSPRAAASRWVNEEIRAFQRLGRAEHIYCLIVDGEPNSGDARECFPPALRAPTPEPIAADARPGGDGRTHAKLKLIAGLLGLSLDALRQRDLRRRQRQLTRITVASVAGMVLTLALAVTALRAQREAEYQQAQAEGLVEFMLGDLRRKLEPVGRLDVMDVVGRRALGYYTDQRLADLDEASIGRRSRALNLIGEIDFRRGDLAAALRAFSEASDTTAVLLERYPDRFQLIFDHAQAVFWVGLIAYQQGELGAAERAFRAYLGFAEQLVALRPDDRQALQELRYGHSNMGDVLARRGQSEAALVHLDASLTLSQSLHEQQPDDDALTADLANQALKLATVLYQLGRLGEAEARLQLQLGLQEALLSRDPSNQALRFRQLAPLGWLAAVYQARGDLPAALETQTRAASLAETLVARDPDNTSWIAQDAMLQARLADMRLSAEDAAGATAALGRLSTLVTQLLARSRDTVEWQDLAALRNLIAARIALRTADAASARTQADAALATLTELSRAHDSVQYARRQAEAHDLLGEAAWAEADTAEAEAHWQQALAILEPHRDDQDCATVELRRKMLLRLGRDDDAQRFAEALRARGQVPLRYTPLPAAGGVTVRQAA